MVAACLALCVSCEPEATTPSEPSRASPDPVEEFAEVLTEPIEGSVRAKVDRATALYADHAEVRAWLVEYYPTARPKARERAMLILERAGASGAVYDEMRPVVVACLDDVVCPGRSAAIGLAVRLDLPDLKERLIAFIDVGPDGSVPAMFAAMKTFLERYGTEGLESVLESKLRAPWSRANRAQAGMILVISAEGSWRERGLATIDALLADGLAERDPNIAAGLLHTFVHVNEPGDGRLRAHAVRLAGGTYGAATEAARAYLNHFFDSN